MASSHCSRSPRSWGVPRAGHGQCWEYHQKKKTEFLLGPPHISVASVVKAFVVKDVQLILLDFQVYLV